MHEYSAEYVDMGTYFGVFCPISDICRSSDMHLHDGMEFALCVVKP